MQSLKKSRTASFAAVFIVYVLAAALGAAVYSALRLSFALSLLIADIAATAFVYLMSVIFNNASVYDPYWSVQPPAILTAAAFLCGQRFTLAGAALLLAVWLWGVRLTANWALGFPGLVHQDWRYTMLREKSGRLYQAVNFLGIHLFPTLVVYLCILPGCFVLRTAAAFNWLSALGFIICLIGTGLEFFADRQMRAFRLSGRGGHIRTGLWKYARHPNYLGEILMWWGVFAQALSSSPLRWQLGLGALVNTLMFLFISIPMADRRQARKPGWREYRAATRSLLPIGKKNHEKC